MNNTSNTPPSSTTKIIIPVNDLSANGTPTGKVSLIELTVAQIGDIISHALQVCTTQRSGEDTDSIIDELSESLGAGGIF